eukprot:jgi/Bigna1/69281/fgenesh1_pg.8_\
MATFKIHADEIIGEKPPPIRKNKGRRRKSIMKKRHSISFAPNSSNVSKKSRMNKRVSFGAKRIREFYEENDHTVDLPSIQIEAGKDMKIAGMKTFVTDQENNFPSSPASTLKLGKGAAVPAARFKSPNTNLQASKSPMRKALSTLTPPSKRVKQAQTPDSAVSGNNVSFFSPTNSEAQVALTEEELALMKQFGLASPDDTKQGSKSFTDASDEIIEVEIRDSTADITSDNTTGTEKQATHSIQNILDISRSPGQQAQYENVSADNTKTLDELLQLERSSDNITTENTENISVVSMTGKNTMNIMGAIVDAATGKSATENDNLDTSRYSEDSGMDMTRNVGTIIAASATEDTKEAGDEEASSSPSASLDVSSMSEGSNMDMTVNIGKVLSANEPLPKIEEQNNPLTSEVSNNSSEDTSEQTGNAALEEDDMEMTVNAGKILSNMKAKMDNNESSKGDAENTESGMELDESMDMTVNAGKILSSSETVVAEPAGSQMESKETVEVVVKQNGEAESKEANKESSELNSTAISLSSDMDLTRNVGGILSKSSDSLKLSPATQVSDMTFTKNVGKIIAADTAPTSAGAISTEGKEASTNASMTMEITENVGKILSASEGKAETEGQEDNDIDFDDRTQNVGDIFALAESEKEDPSQNAVNFDEETMDITRVVGGVIASESLKEGAAEGAAEESKVVQSEEVDNSEKVTIEEQTMDMTTAVGGIISVGGATVDEKSATLTTTSSSSSSSSAAKSKPAAELNESRESTQVVRVLRMDDNGDDTKEMMKIMGGDGEDRTCDLPKPEQLSDVTRNMEDMIGKLLAGEMEVDEDDDTTDHKATVVEVLNHSEVVEEQVNDNNHPITPAAASKRNLAIDGDSKVDIIKDLGTPQSFSTTPTSIQSEESTARLEQFFSKMRIQFPKLQSKRRASSFGTTGTRWPPQNLTELLEFSITGLVTELKEQWISHISECVKRSQAESLHMESYLNMHHMPRLLHVCDQSSPGQQAEASRRLQEAYNAFRLDAKREFAEYERLRTEEVLEELQRNKNAIVSDRVVINRITSHLDEVLANGTNSSRSLSLSVSDLDALKLEAMEHARFLKQAYSELGEKKTRINGMRRQVAENNLEVEARRKQSGQQAQQRATLSQLQAKDEALQSKLHVLEAAVGQRVIDFQRGNGQEAQFTLDVMGVLMVKVEMDGDKVVEATIKSGIAEDNKANGDDLHGEISFKKQILAALVNSPEAQSLFEHTTSSMKKSNNGLHKGLQELSLITCRFVDLASEAHTLYFKDNMTIFLKKENGKLRSLQILCTNSQNKGAVALNVTLAPGYPSRLNLTADVHFQGVNAEKHRLDSKEAVLEFASSIKGRKRLTKICRQIRTRLAM